MSLLNKCIYNKNNHRDIKIGENYELFEHEDSSLVWVKIIDSDTSVGYRTTQAYKTDFKSIEIWRNSQIDKIIN